VACATLLWANAAQAQSSNTNTAPASVKPMRSDVGGDKPRSLLWVGNSFFYYNNSMHSHVAALSKAADLKPSLRGVSVAISASGLDWHDMASYLKPGVLGKYSFAEDNSVRFNKSDKQFDAVIMMDCSQCPVHPQLKQVFHDTVKSHTQTILKAGARPVLFMSWAYKDKPEMTAQLAEQYTIAANANDALVSCTCPTCATPPWPAPTCRLVWCLRPSRASRLWASATPPVCRQTWRHTCKPWLGKPYKSTQRSKPLAPRPQPQPKQFQPQSKQLAGPASRPLRQVTQAARPGLTIGAC
jgi:hypothetical protein